MQIRSACCLAALLLAAALGGCASRGMAPAHAGLLQDAAVAPPAEPVNATQVFALSQPMRAFLDRELPTFAATRDLRTALIEALYKPGQLRLQYDAGTTRNASQAFEARAGNCLSLVIMTAAMARHLGVTVTFQSVVTDEAYQRVGSLVLASGHVNLVLGRPSIGSLIGRPDAQWLTVDFLPARELVGARATPIADHTVLAMFMNNRAAEVLAEGRAAEAYWWAREAVIADPQFAAGVNTLGVVYRNLGLLGPAEQALRHVLQGQPDHTPALGNLARVLEAAGRPDEAQVFAERLLALQPYPPFHFFDLGRRAFAEGRADAARGLFERELSRQPHQPMVLAWLAQAHQSLGRGDRATKALAEAVEYSTSVEQRQVYSAKLAALRAAGAPL